VRISRTGFVRSFALLSAVLHLLRVWSVHEKAHPYNPNERTNERMNERTSKQREFGQCSQVHCIVYVRITLKYFFYTASLFTNLFIYSRTHSHRFLVFLSFFLSFFLFLFFLKKYRHRKWNNKDIARQISPRWPQTGQRYLDCRKSFCFTRFTVYRAFLRSRFPS